VDERICGLCVSVALLKDNKQITTADTDNAQDPGVETNKLNNKHLKPAGDGQFDPADCGHGYWLLHPVSSLHQGFSSSLRRASSIVSLVPV
jgi:hypothetical protein